MWALLDPFLLAFYQATGIEYLDGLIGTFLVSLLAAVIGEFTISIVFRLNREHIDRLNGDLEKFNTLSREAMRIGDEASYRALNRQGNDAYGQVFFNQICLSAATLWPVFFALDWMQGHFATSGIPVPFCASGVNYVAAFLCCYVLARIVFGRLKRYLPYFKGQYAMILAHEKRNTSVDRPLG